MHRYGFFICVFYIVHLNTFFWKGVRRFHQTLEGPVAQRMLKTSELVCLASLNLELHFAALDLLNQARLTRVLSAVTYEMRKLILISTPTNAHT